MTGTLISIVATLQLMMAGGIFVGAYQLRTKGQEQRRGANFAMVVSVVMTVTALLLLFEDLR